MQINDIFLKNGLHKITSQANELFECKNIKSNSQHQYQIITTGHENGGNSLTLETHLWKVGYIIPQEEMTFQVYNDWLSVQAKILAGSLQSKFLSASTEDPKKIYVVQEGDWSWELEEGKVIRTEDGLQKATLYKWATFVSYSELPPRYFK